MTMLLIASFALEKNWEKGVGVLGNIFVWGSVTPMALLRVLMVFTHDLNIGVRSELAPNTTLIWKKIVKM